jgi:hypothetical protein
VVLGKVYEKLNKIDEAILEFQTAIKVPTPNLSAHFNLGVQYEKKKMNKDAV